MSRLKNPSHYEKKLILTQIVIDLPSTSILVISFMLLFRRLDCGSSVVSVKTLEYIRTFSRNSHQICNWEGGGCRFSMGDLDVRHQIHLVLLLLCAPPY